jgi:hypothetical protein
LRQNYENITIKTMLNSRCRLVGGCLLLSIAGLFVPNQVLAQTQSAETADTPKWEIGINALALTERKEDQFGYIVKRYVQADQGRQAIRFKFSPRLSSIANSSSTSNAINVAVGYEWQQPFDRFAVVYGVEPFYKYSRNEIKLGNPSPLKQRDININIGASFFLGGRCKIGKHWSASIESHLYYNHRTFIVENDAATASLKEYEISITPLHAVYMHYHF